MMNKLGQKGILDDQKKEKILKELIFEYDESRNSSSKIRYNAIFEFVKEKFDNGLIDFYPSKTWWKTTGKFLVDEYNLIAMRTIIISDKESIDVMDIADIVEKYHKDKNKLSKFLKPYSSLIDRLVDKINALQTLIKNIELNNQQKDKKLVELEEAIKNQQKLVDSLFFEIVSSEQNLKSLIKHEKINSDTINFALSEAFGDPVKYVQAFCNRNFKEGTIEKEHKENVVDFKPRKDSAMIIEDDYDY